MWYIWVLHRTIHRHVLITYPLVKRRMYSATFQTCTLHVDASTACNDYRPHYFLLTLNTLGNNCNNAYKLRRDREQVRQKGHMQNPAVSHAV